jgi:hypothetical protein
MIKTNFKLESKSTFIVHFDDHPIFTDGVKKIIEKTRSDFQFRGFNEYY